MDAVFVYITAANREEALRIGRIAVAERLAACANLIDGMRTIYRWRGELREEEEVVLILKTLAERLPELTRRVRALHSYECPCIAALPASPANEAYFDWIAAEVSPVAAGDGG